MVAQHALTDLQLSSLLDDMITIDGDERRQENADFANEHIKIYINSQPVKITEVTLYRGNNHSGYHCTLNVELKKEDIKEIVVQCNA